MLCSRSQKVLYFASEGLAFKVLLLVDNALDHTEPHEFNTKGIKMVLPLKHIVSNSASWSGSHKYLEMIVNTIEENTDRTS